LLRVRRLAQPDQSFGMQLSRALTTEAQPGPNLAIEGTRLPGQLVAGQNDNPQSLRQPGYQVPDGRMNDRCLPGLGRVRRFRRRTGGFVKRQMPCCLPMGALGKLDLSPDMMHNGGPGVGGKGMPPFGVKAQDGAPQADATCLQGLDKRQLAQYLLAHDGRDQSLVRCHESRQAVTATSLRLAKKGGPGGQTGAACRSILVIHGTPPSEMSHYPTRRLNRGAQGRETWG